MKLRHSYHYRYLPMICIFLVSGILIGNTPLLAQTGSATSSVVPSNTTLHIDDQIEVTINIDVSNVNSPDNKLGSFTGSVSWNPAVLTYVSNSGISSPFTGIANPGTNTITFGGMCAAGVTGSIDIIRITFKAVGAGTSVLDLNYSAMAAATTFKSLRGILSINDGNVIVTAVRTLTMAVNPEGGGTTTPAVGPHDYDEGTVVPITATPATGFRFVNWTGTGIADLNSASTTVTVDGNKTATANFVRVYTLNMAVNPAGGGTTTPAVGAHNYDEGTVVTIGASANAGFGFKNWTVTGGADVADSNNPNTTVTVDGNKTVTANFDVIRILNMQVNPPGGGTTIPAVGSHDYGNGAVVPITATPATGYRFVNWTGSGITDPNSSSTTITMNANKTVTANFGKIVDITINTSPIGLGFSVDGTPYTSTQTFNWLEGSTHTILVTSPQSGGTGIQYVYTLWSDGGAQSHTYTVPGTAQTVTANFKTQYYLTVSSTYGSPTGQGWYDAGSNANFGVTTPASGGAGNQYVFTGWTGNGSGSYTGSNASSSVTMNNSITETASWKTQYYLTTSENPDAGGNMTPAPPGGWYDNGTVVPVDATVTSGYDWGGWSGDLTGSIKPNSITMTGPKTVAANFGILVPITINTNPTGRSFSVDGTPYTSTQTFNWLGGSTHTILVTSPQSGGIGIQYLYTSWSDGGAQSHTYTVPGTAQTVTANFKIQYYLTVSSTYGSPTGQGWYDAGGSANFGVTTPVSGGAGTQYVFTGWTGSGSGSYTGSNPSSSVTMNNPITETASWKTQYQLTVSSARGTPSGAGWYDAGANANFWVTPTTVSGGTGTQYLFTSWTGSGSGSYTGSNSSSSVTMNNPITETADWQTQYYLTTSENPDAGGNMTPAPPGGWYNNGAVVAVNATEASGYNWGGWSGDLTGSTRPNSITMTSPKAVTANFGIIVTYTFTTDPTGRSYKVDGVTYTSQQSFVWGAGTIHTIGGQTTQSGGTGIQYVLYSIQDNSGNEFLPGGSLPSETSVQFPVGVTDKTITGKFRTQYYLTVSSSYGSPTGQGWYNAGSTANFGVTSPISGGAGTQYIFTGWTGSGSSSYTGSNASSSVTMNNPITETASWKTQYYLTVSSAHGTAPGSGWYDAGSPASFSVSPTMISGGSGTQYVFTGWTGSGSGSYTGSDASSSVTMNNPITETANWKTQYYLTTSENPDAGGDMTPAPPGGWYDSGTAVNVDATVAGGYQWAGWSGSLSGTTKPTTITMNGPKSVTANFANIQITIATNPSGRTIVVDGSTYTSPQTFTWVVNSSHSISTSSPQSGGSGIQYVFTSWSDGGAQTHSYIVPGSNATVTSTFKTQYYLNVSSSHGSPSGSGWYDAGTNGYFSVTSPDIQGTTRYLFLNWTGDASGSNTSGSVNMNGPKNVYANWKTQYYLNVNSPHGNPQGSNWYDAGTTANFSVTTPDVQGTTKYLFLNWSGDYSGTSPAGSTIMDIAKTVTANWTSQYYLATHESPDEGGNMTPAPPGGWYDQGSQVECSAVADTDYVFGGWSGDLSGTLNPATLVMDNSKDVTANFTLKGKVQITSDPSGLTVSVDGSSYTTPHNFSWEHGSSHSIGIVDTLQNGASGIRYHFQNWSDGGAKNHTITVDGTPIYIANFKVQYYLTTASNPPEGGDVVPAPAGPWYDANNEVQLSAIAKTENGYEFSTWGGDLTGNANPATLVMNGPKSVTGVFTLQTFHLTTKVEPSGAGIINCIPEKSDYVFGEKVKIVEVANLGYKFKGWNVDGTDFPVSDTLKIVMDKDKLVTAKFEKNPDAVDERNIAGMPNDYRLFQSYPNPFNPRTTIVFQLPKMVNVTLEVYNSAGRRIRTLLNEMRSAGTHETVWNGKDDFGNSVSSGIYYYQIRTKDFCKVMKMVYMK